MDEGLELSEVESKVADTNSGKRVSLVATGVELKESDPEVEEVVGEAPIGDSDLESGESVAWKVPLAEVEKPPDEGLGLSDAGACDDFDT